MYKAPELYLHGYALYNENLIFGPLELQVMAGQWTCLLGLSGVGKSTILRLFAGLNKKINFIGSYGAKHSSLIGHVALMTQNDLLLPWLTIEQNVALGMRLRGDLLDIQKILTILQLVGLTNMAHRKPNSLSGGERQRVALARTLIEDRPIVLLDEPFSALDVKNRSQMQDLAVEMLHGRTVLLVTHDTGEAVRLGHNIAIMTQNKINYIESPLSKIPRPVDDKELLYVQANLLRYLRDKS